MQRTKSAKKALRQSLKRRGRNTDIKRRVKNIFKEIQSLVKGGKKTEAQKMLTQAYSLIDKAAKTHVFHKNKASRKKSQLAKMTA